MSNLTSDAKQLVEDEETGAQTYRYVKTGENHLDFAFTYDCMAAARQKQIGGPFVEFVNLDDLDTWVPLFPRNW